MSHHAASNLTFALCIGSVLMLGCDLSPTSVARSAAERTTAATLAADAAEAASASAELDAPHPSGLSVATHTVINPPRTGDPKEDYWIQYQVLGEITNHTHETLELVSANLRFYDDTGKMLGVESIGTLSKRDAGDTSPGETIWADVHFVEPGGSVPFHFRRNLAAVDGQIASHRLVPRHARSAVNPPRGVVTDLRERFEGEGVLRTRVFEGKIRNEGSGGCRWPTFVVAFLDADGEMFALESEDPGKDTKRVLAKGEDIAFTASVFVTGEYAEREHAKVRTWADCKPE